MFDLLEIRTLGQLHIQWRSTATAVTLAPRETMLLIYLAYHQLPLSRHHFYDLLWPDEPRPRAQGNLRKLLMDIRRTLGDLIVADRHTVTLQDTPRSIWLDVHRFKWHMAPLAQVHRPQQAASIDIPKLIEGVKLYQGDFLVDLKAPRSYLLSAWVEQEQENLRRQMELALRTLVAYLSGRAQYREAAHYANQLLQLDPFDEQMVGELMRLWTQVGAHEQALTLFRTYRQRLRHATREGPGAALEQLYQTIRGGIVPPITQAPIAQAQSSAFPNATGPNPPTARVVAPAGRSRRGKTYHCPSR